MAEPSGNKQTAMVLAFAAGVLVGINWPKIKQHIGPLITAVSNKSAEMYSGIAKFMAEQKESMEDKVAASKVRKVKKTQGGRKKPLGSLKVNV